MFAQHCSTASRSDRVARRPDAAESARSHLRDTSSEIVFGDGWMQNELREATRGSSQTVESSLAILLMEARDSNILKDQLEREPFGF